MNLNQIHNVYFIGIGGIGMSALARYFQFIGKKVVGYDKTPTQLTDELQAIGLEIHFEDNINLIPEEFYVENTLVIFTPAVPVSHSEWNYFIEIQNNIPLKENDSWTHIRSCLSGALGLGELYYLLIQNPRALATARGTLSLLKHIGGRYLGYIGLGLAIFDFADCISN